MKITIPLVLDGHGAVQYPGTPSDWSNSSIDGSLVVGEYSGALYQSDGVTKAFDWTTWTAVAPTYGTIITPLALLNRFLPAEEAAIRNAQAGSVAVQGLMDRIHLASFIDLQDPNTDAGINALVAASLLTTERAAAILTTPAAWNELPSSMQALYPSH